MKTPRRDDAEPVRIRPFAGAIAALATLVAAVSAPPALSAPARGGSASTLVSLESAILVQLNQIRVSHGLVPLRLNTGLTDAATAHSADMLARGYFSHDSADGTPFSSRLVHYYPESPYGVWSVGENLEWATGNVDAAIAVQHWMQSPEHRDNILRPRWREIGIAALRERHAPGAFGGRTVTLLATDFGVRHR
jgi:uncharacterized protein YkwD